MEQFSLEKYLENPSRKVVTERNKEVRIICTDINCAYPIIAAIKINDDRETPLSYDINGKCAFYEGNDLFFADEKEELTEFEKAMINIVFKYKYWSNSKDEVKQYIKKDSKPLLDLARKELLKDLPKWKKATKPKNFDNHIILFKDKDRVILTTEIYEDEYYIELDDLKTLPKE